MADTTPRGWTDAAWNWAKKQWLTGRSGSEISRGLKEMGWSKTRSAVIGAMNYNGIFRTDGDVTALANRIKAQGERKDRQKAPKRPRGTTKSRPSPAGRPMTSTNFSNKSEIGHLSELREGLTYQNPLKYMPLAKVRLPKNTFSRPSSPFATCQWESCDQPTETRRGRRCSYCVSHAAVVYRRTA